MGRKTCVGCGREFEVGYYVLDEHAKSDGWLCDDCFEEMCFNKVARKLGVNLNIEMDRMVVRFYLNKDRS